MGKPQRFHSLKGIYMTFMAQIVSLLLVTTIIGCSKTHTQDDLDILTIFNQFVISNAAASKCENPDQKTLHVFSVNFQMIYNRASIKLEKKFPKYTKKKINEVLKNKFEITTRRTVELVRKKGCEDQNIQVVIKRFYVQAKWNPYKNY